MFERVIDSIAPVVKPCAGDYKGEDGFLHCGKCHEAKEAYLFTDESIIPDLPGFDKQKKRPRNCACDRDRIAKENEKAEREAAFETIKRLRAQGMTDAQYKNSRFDNDDGKDPEASQKCRLYVERWEEFKKIPDGGGGLILYGAPGGGKTFFASCIANALIDKGVPVIMDTIPRIAARMNRNYGENKEKILDDIRTVPLLIIDDFGIEKDTNAALQSMYEIINERYKAQKPLIVTTNLTMDAIKGAKEARYQRIYGRITQMCPFPIHAQRQGRRQDAARVKFEAMQRIFQNA